MEYDDFLDNVQAVSISFRNIHRLDSIFVASLSDFLLTVLITHVFCDCYGIYNDLLTDMKYVSIVFRYILINWLDEVFVALTRIFVNIMVLLGDVDDS